ncbi:hypothetical protein ACO1O0_001321 [Amphichorda felina]
MASLLPRGLFHPNILRPQLLRPRPILSELSHPQSRFSTASLRLRAAAPKANVNIKTTPSTIRPPKAAPQQQQQQQQSSYALIKSLATKPTPTVLYEGPSNFWFYFGCWSSGLSILTWTALTGPWVIFHPEGTEGVPDWVTWVNGSSYVLLAAMGFYLISKTPNIVKSIRVLPSAVSRAAPTTFAAAAPATTTPSLQVEVTVHRMMPLARPKVLTADLDRVSLKSRLSLPGEHVPDLRRDEARRLEEARKRELRRFDMEHLMTMPFRKLGRGLTGMFHGVRAAWTDMGFGVIRVDGKEYKVNVTKGFAHDGFRTLERIVPIKEK